LSALRIIFVPGMKPKPPPDVFRRELLRVLIAALRRVRPDSGRWLEAHKECFSIVPWTFLLYGVHRDIALDRQGIERLLAQSVPSAEDLAEIASLASRRFRHASHRLGDALPLLRRFLAQPAMRLTIHEAHRYLDNLDGVADRIRALLRTELTRAWHDDEKVLLIAHSMGSVIAYDTLWELSHGDVPARGEIDLFMTLGSPLATRFMRRGLRGARARGRDRYPTIIRRWANFAAKGDVMALYPRLQPFFREMLALGLVEALDDYFDLENHFRGAIGLNVHESYGYLSNPYVARAIGDWLAAAE
jgi:hypothetical protein